MRRCIFRAMFLLMVLLPTGCGDSGRSVEELARKAAEERAAKERADREQALREKEKLAAENRVHAVLKKDFEQLVGHWDHPGGKNPDGKPRPSIHLEITPNRIARFRMVAGSGDSSTECPIHLTNQDGQRLIVQSEGASPLKFSPLAYRLDGDKLTIVGSANDVLLREVDLSGEWRRTDWTKKSEAEIADALKQLDAQLGYDDDNPANPIGQVKFKFQAPVHNEHLRIVAGLKHLHLLDLSEATNLSDIGLKYLAALKQLKQLNLRTLSVSNEAVQQLRGELPNCEILR